ncbi:hypothetical protein BJ508DRAFT_36812 [Ascobolus immersus RN42]|uniref:Uncharacterized protein n=1 Tax=Ascobolus immersus RN42 TaxID=1160509 RepID=A0A3N4IJH5_ASCIM|nr:hypothetical protein BJ508DRAFT_36812 [Ascobolus immersus RN42]
MEGRACCSSCSTKGHHRSATKVYPLGRSQERCHLVGPSVCVDCSGRGLFANPFSDVRIFTIRFRKIHKIPKKHLDTVSNPTGAWTNQTYKAVIIAALKVMQADDKRYWDNDVIYSLIKEVENKSSSKYEEFWRPLEEFFSEYKHFLQEHTFEDDEDRMEYNQAILTFYIQRISMNSSVARNLLMEDQVLAKEKHREFTESKAQLTKDMVGTKGDERAVFNMRIGLLDFEHWYTQRALSSRSDPLLGQDVLGNKYYFFNQTSWLEDAWGHWIIVEKSPKLLHPSGKSRPSPEPAKAADGDIEMQDAPVTNGFSAINSVPKPAENQLAVPPAPSSVASSTPGPEAQLQKEIQEHSEEIDEDFDPSISWFCVFDSQEASKLGAWLSYQTLQHQLKNTLEPEIEEKNKQLINVIRRIAAYYEHEENAKARQFEIEETLSKGI